MAESRAKLFEESHGSIEEALRYVAFRRRLPPFEFQELRSYVSLKLIENDYARLRKQSAEGSGGRATFTIRERICFAWPMRFQYVTVRVSSRTIRLLGAVPRSRWIRSSGVKAKSTRAGCRQSST